MGRANELLNYSVALYEEEEEEEEASTQAIKIAKQTREMAQKCKEANARRKICRAACDIALDNIYTIDLRCNSITIARSM